MEKARRMWVRLTRPSIGRHLEENLPPHYSENIEALKKLRELAHSALEYARSQGLKVDEGAIRSRLERIDNLLGALEERALDHYKNVPPDPRKPFELSSRALSAYLPITVKTLASELEKWRALTESPLQMASKMTKPLERVESLSDKTQAFQRRLDTVYLKILALLHPEIAKKIGDSEFQTLVSELSQNLQDFLEKHEKVIRHLRGGKRAGN